MAEDGNNNVIVLILREAGTIGQWKNWRTRQQCLPIWVKKKDTAEKLRPIANSLAIAAQVPQLLVVAPNLRLSDSFKNVSLCSRREESKKSGRDQLQN